jgi:hypothetical protein
MVATMIAHRQWRERTLGHVIVCLMRGHAVSEMSFGRFCDRCQTVLDCSRVQRRPLGPEHLAVLRLNGWDDDTIARHLPTLAPLLTNERKRV